MRVKRKGRLTPREKYKYFREDNKELWNELRAGKVVEIDLKELRPGLEPNLGKVAVDKILDSLGLEEISSPSPPKLGKMGVS